MMEQAELIERLQKIRTLLLKAIGEFTQLEQELYSEVKPKQKEPEEPNLIKSFLDLKEEFKKVDEKLKKKP